MKISKTDEPDLIDLIISFRCLSILRLENTIKEQQTYFEIFRAISKNAFFGVNGVLPLSLDLGRNLIFSGSERIQEFADCITLTRKICTLNLSGIGLKAKGAMIVLYALPNNVTTLILDDNFEVPLMGSENIQIDLGNALAKLLETNFNLIYLSIASKSVPIGPSLRPLFKAIKRNKNLHYLNFSGNEVGDACFSTLCRSLCVNTTLVGIKFSNNNLSTNGFISLDQMLSVNTTLQYINFIDDFDIFYDKFCSEKHAGELLLQLHESCILRRSGLSWAKDIFVFDSVNWDTPETVTPLVIVPTRLVSVTADWHKLTEMSDEAIKVVPDTDENCSSLLQGEEGQNESIGDISRKSTTKK